MKTLLIIILNIFCSSAFAHSIVDILPQQVKNVSSMQVMDLKKFTLIKINPDKTRSPLQISLQLLKLHQVEQSLLVIQSFNRTESPDQAMVEIVHSNLLDDSIAAIYYQLVFNKKRLNSNSNHWQLNSVQQAFKCRRSHSEEFSEKWCS